MSFKSSSIKLLTWMVRPGVVASCMAFFFRRLLRVFPIRRKTVARNLEIALPDKTPEERKLILRGTYDHLVWLGIEFAILQRDPRQALEWMKVENPDALDDSVGGILLACHVGNWELAAAWFAQSGHRMTAIVRESSDSGERDAIATMRSVAGVDCLPKTAPMTRALSALRRNEFLAIMPDQHGGADGVVAPLFGINTPTSKGAAVFAYLTKKPLIPVYTRRVSPFSHVMRFGEPVEWEGAGDRDETIYAITLAINKAIERIIRETPDQWLAQHRRFRELDGGGLRGKGQGNVR
ncbi:MAG: lysophospholipid acyltransferase family protein [Synergistaceae bacterium]|nr:lysophospholipid acyltransferase family protein [Synergistaceae bacterium]